MIGWPDWQKKKQQILKLRKQEDQTILVEKVLSIQITL
jgi:hypothetical protein